MTIAGGRGTAGSRHTRLHAHAHADDRCTFMGERHATPRTHCTFTRTALCTTLVSLQQS